MELVKLDDYRWEIKKTGRMNVPARIYSSASLIKSASQEGPLQQLVDVASLPGIMKASLAMPDMHWGYGFPIGGVAAFDCEEGVISPGGVGYDINCGVRLCTTELVSDEFAGKLKKLADEMEKKIPTGIGRKGELDLSGKELKKVMSNGAEWAAGRGYGELSDMERIEDGGVLRNADPAAVGPRAIERGCSQLGTLGSGNHFIEIGQVESVYDQEAARVFGLKEGRLTVLLHTGSRGFGHQICDDFLAEMNRKPEQNLNPPNRQLVCSWFRSPQGQKYFNAMACAANFAWANRQVLNHHVKKTLLEVLGLSSKDLQMRLVYDVCHNIAKTEYHEIEGERRLVCVHRKGATRSFGPGSEVLPEIYRQVGQPVLIPGDMGTSSYVLAGTGRAMVESFGSTCHGAGREMSRKAAVRAAKGRGLRRELENRGVFVRASGKNTMAEEMPDAYKDITEVVSAAHQSGISKIVAKLRPLVVVKG